jgi:hypothetical protein
MLVPAKPVSAKTASTQLALEQLAAGVLGQAVDEDHALGRLEAGHVRGAVGAMTSASVSVWPALTTTTAVTASIQRGCGRPITATSLTCGQAVDRLLDLAAGHVLAAGLDHVLLAVDDGDVALVVDRGQVAAVEPVAGSNAAAVRSGSLK